MAHDSKGISVHSSGEGVMERWDCVLEVPHILVGNSKLKKQSSG